MIRLIVKRSFACFGSPPDVSFRTLDVEIPELDALLRAGGVGGPVTDYEFYTLIGAEVVGDPGAEVEVIEKDREVPF